MATVSFVKADAGVHQQDDHVGALDFAPGPFDPHLLDLIVGGTQTCGVNHMQRYAFDLQCAAHQIAGRTGERGDDGQFVPGKTIEQAGLADIGLTGQHHIQATLQQMPLLGTLEYQGQTLLQAVETSEGIGRFKKVQLLVRKIQSRLDQHPQFDQLCE
jgi:hypothetical protein